MGKPSSSRALETAQPSRLVPSSPHPRPLHTREVAGSIPAAPIAQPSRFSPLGLSSCGRMVSEMVSTGPTRIGLSPTGRARFERPPDSRRGATGSGWTLVPGYRAEGKGDSASQNCTSRGSWLLVRVRFRPYPRFPGKVTTTKASGTNPDPCCAVRVSVRPIPRCRSDNVV